MPLTVIARTPALPLLILLTIAQGLFPFNRYVTLRGAHSYVMSLTSIALTAVLTPTPGDGRLFGCVPPFTHGILTGLCAPAVNRDPHTLCCNAPVA